MCDGGSLEFCEKTMQNSTMSDWDNLQVILAIRRCGSIGGAARAMRLNYSTVNRRLSAYEDALGTKLFKRGAKGQTCTSAGVRICEAAERMETELADAERSVVGADANLEGELRVTMSSSLFHAVMGPVLGVFSEQYPEIRLTLSFTSNISDLAKREADIAFRFSNNPPESLVGTRIGNCAEAIYASPAYVANSTSENRLWIGWKDRSQHPGWVQNSAEPQARIHHNALDNMAKSLMAAEGMGMAMLPCFLGDQNPLLVRLRPRDTRKGRDLWILTHEDIRETARVRALMDFSREQLKSKAALLSGHEPAGTNMTDEK